MSMYRVFSCVVGRGCLLWPVHFLGKTLLAFALLHSILQVHGWPKQSEELVASPLGRPLCGCWRSSAGSKSPPPHEPSTQSFLCCPQSHPQLPETAGTLGATPVCCFQKITVLCSILLSWNRRNHFISPSADVTLNLKTCCLCEDVTSFLLVQYWLPRYILMQKTEKN